MTIAAATAAVTTTATTLSQCHSSGSPNGDQTVVWLWPWHLRGALEATLLGPHFSTSVLVSHQVGAAGHKPGSWANQGPGCTQPKGSFTLRDSTMWYRTHESLITLNNGLGPPKTKSVVGFRERSWVGGCVGRIFVLSVPNPFLKSHVSYIIHVV